MKKLKVVEKVEKCKPPGNTRKQVAASKYWCFTLHKYTEQDIVDLVEEFIGFDYIFGEETGKSGETPHLQGYVWSTGDKTEWRPSQFKMWKTKPETHWTRREKTHKACIIYCQKEQGNIYSSILDECRNIYKEYLQRNTKHVIRTLETDSLYDWQRKQLLVVGEDPDDRSITWIWDEKGRTGKSSFCKYLCLKHKAIIVGGRDCDMKYAVSEYTKNTGKYPKIVLIDLARAFKVGKFSYTGIEDIKNGCFFTSKYESGMCMGNPPHIIVFANIEPEYDKMTKDKWNTICLD